MRTVFFITLLALIAAIYSYTVFSNLCVDGDTLNWAQSLEPYRGRMTFLNLIALKGWFAKFHLLLFSLVYLVARAYELLSGRWDYLIGFKITTLACALLTPLILYRICGNRMRNSLPLIATSFIPICALGYSWMITTCDDNVIANFFNILFLACLLVAAGAIYEEKREARPCAWALIAGLAAGLSMASHLKNIVWLPVLLVLFAVRPPRQKSRILIGVIGILGFVISFGLLYWLYWIQSAAEPASSKLDFWVFHRVPGRFFLTPPHPPITNQIYLSFVGIRSSLYAFQELFINTNLYDRDILGYVTVALFFSLYAVSVRAMRRDLMARILFLVFVLDAGHSFLYDCWVVERWDSFTIPVFLTIGLHWDRTLTRRGGIKSPASVCLSLLILAFFGMLIWSNIRSTRLLLGITNNSIPCRQSAKKWPFPTIFYFYFDHRGLYEAAKKADSLFDDRTYFLSLRYIRDTHPRKILEQYLDLYSANYRLRRIENVGSIGYLASQGRLTKLLYLDTLKVPFYTDTSRAFIIFDPATSRTAYENSQLTLGEASFTKSPDM